MSQLHPNADDDAYDRGYREEASCWKDARIAHLEGLLKRCQPWIAGESAAGLAADVTRALAPPPPFVVKADGELATNDAKPLQKDWLDKLLGMNAALAAAAGQKLK